MEDVIEKEEEVRRGPVMKIRVLKKAKKKKTNGRREGRRRRLF